MVWQLLLSVVFEHRLKCFVRELKASEPLYCDLWSIWTAPPSVITSSPDGWNSPTIYVFCFLRIFLSPIFFFKVQIYLKDMSYKALLLEYEWNYHLPTWERRNMSEYEPRQEGMRSRMSVGRTSPRTFVDFTILPVSGIIRIGRIFQCLFIERGIY